MANEILPSIVMPGRSSWLALSAAMFTGALDDDAGTLIRMLRPDDDDVRPPAMSEDARDYHWRELFAAVAMGVALGQLVHPDVFAKGGAR